MSESDERLDEKFMRIALDCAARGLGAVEPNPMVGAVIVRDGRELARGWHRKFGGPHAEIEALRAARGGGTDVRGATMYVSLEPCCHRNKKTPPCTDALIDAGLARVVVAMADPDPNVAGRGLRILRDAGIEVESGVLAAPAADLLRAYVKLRRSRRPWVICKWAQTIDGFLARPPGDERWVSGPESRARVHELRGVCDGILVGAGTVLADDPLLTNRSGAGTQPVRVVLDASLRISGHCQLAESVGISPVIVATTLGAQARSARTADALRARGVELMTIEPGDGGVDLPALLDELARRQWTRLLVEGGPAVLGSFVDGGLADELTVFVSPRAVGEKAEDLPRFDIAAVRERMELHLREDRLCGEDRMLVYGVGGATAASR